MAKESRAKPGRLVGLPTESVEAAAYPVCAHWSGGLLSNEVTATRHETNEY